MIRLTRPPAPAFFRSPHLWKAVASVAAFFDKKAPQSSMEWEEITKMLRKETERHLLKMSHCKCAYCETPLPVTGGFNLEFFRPKQCAIGRRGDVSEAHYWWLALEWTNLLPSCQACNLAKGARFPVDAPRVAERQGGADALLAEKPLLLDPTADNPEKHLIFNEDGYVFPTPGCLRGEVTIEVLALNRHELVRSRRHTVHLLKGGFQNLLKKASQHGTGGLRASRNVILKTLGTSLHDNEPYTAIRRQMLKLWIGEMSDRTLAAKINEALSLHLPAPDKDCPGPRTRKSIERARDTFTGQMEAKEQHSVEAQTPEAKRAYFSGQRRIERIIIKNFKRIRHLELTVPSASSDRESWLMLLGENGTGKSSVLQAVALALLGAQHLPRLALDASTFVRHGEQSGSVTVELTNVSKPVVLSFSKKNRRFSVSTKKELVLLLGYGATRLLPRSATTKNTPTRYVRVKNLFNPYARLQNAERWLADRKKVKDSLFLQISKSLRQLLLLPDNAQILRERSRIKIEVHGHQSSLQQLSDGFQSVVALAVDIMMGLVVRWASMEQAEGIVLIDELETHLHPRWKMEIVSRLRRVFPKLTFIVTTHDPLCLRGLQPGEVAVLSKNDEGEISHQIITESLDHLRADQLLTSPLFGLVHTRSADVQNGVERYAALASKAARSPAEEAEMISLSGKLASLQADEAPSRTFVTTAVTEILANTPPERLWGSLGTTPLEVSDDLKDKLRQQLAGLTAASPPLPGSTSPHVSNEPGGDIHGQTAPAAMSDQ